MVAKALADMTAAGELANPRDERGYRLPDGPRWRKRTKATTLFRPSGVARLCGRSPRG